MAVMTIARARLLHMMVCVGKKGAGRILEVIFCVRHNRRNALTLRARHDARRADNHSMIQRVSMPMAAFARARASTALSSGCSPPATAPAGSNRTVMEVTKRSEASIRCHENRDRRGAGRNASER